MFTLRPVRVLVVLAGVIGFAPAALAGPPLICHPFVTDAAAPLLPWVPGRDFYSPHPDYDLAALTADTLKLLSPDAAILTRMENMRRATIYAEQDATVAKALLDAVVERARAPQADARAAALATFDAGYLLETYRQLDLVYQHGMRSAHGRGGSMVPAEHRDLDGYALVRQALAQAPLAELEFAASLMTPQALAAAHADKAKSGAVPDSLLARNLETFWTD